MEVPPRRKPGELGRPLGAARVVPHVGPEPRCRRQKGCGARVCHGRQSDDERAAQNAPHDRRHRPAPVVQGLEEGDTRAQNGRGRGGRACVRGQQCKPAPRPAVRAAAALLLCTVRLARRPFASSTREVFNAGGAVVASVRS